MVPVPLELVLLTPWASTPALPEITGGFAQTVGAGDPEPSAKAGDTDVTGHQFAGNIDNTRVSTPNNTRNRQVFIWRLRPALQ